MRPVGGQESSQKADKFVIDHDMDPGTATESNLSLKSRSFLNRVNDRLRRILDNSSKDAMEDIDKTFYNLGNVHVCNIGIICIHGEGIIQKIYIPSKIQGRISH